VRMAEEILLSQQEIFEIKPQRPGTIVMCYSLLDQSTVKKNMYPNSPNKCLKFHRRYPKIFLEINEIKPHILCLQEVNRKLQAILVAQLNNYYTTVYQVQPDLYNCSIFFNKKLYSLVDQHIVYLDTVIPYLYKHKFKATSANSLNMVILQQNPTENKEFLCVATVQFDRDTTRPEVKFRQVQMVLYELQIFMEKNGMDNYERVILCGDWWFTPYSGLYYFLTKGSINKKEWDPLQLDRLECIQPSLVDKVYEEYNESLQNKTVYSLSERRTLSSAQTFPGLYKEDSLIHPFNFKSAYSSSVNLANEPYCTTYSMRFNGCVDYIFYSSDLDVLKRSPLPNRQQLVEIGGIPHQKYGSDHFFLSCELSLFSTILDEISKDQPEITPPEINSIQRHFKKNPRMRKPKLSKLEIKNLPKKTIFKERRKRKKKLARQLKRIRNHSSRD